MPTPPDLLDRLMDFEAGLLDEDATITLFQSLIDSGLAWTLQGSYGRMAQMLIEDGACAPPVSPEGLH